MAVKFLFLFLLGLGGGSAWSASDFEKEYFFYQGARALGMGNAFTAIADDEQALYYNPAGLARNDRYRLHLVSLDVATSAETISTFTESQDTFKEFNSTAIQSVYGKNIYGQATFAPILLMGPVAAGFILDGKAGVKADNPVLPEVRLGAQVNQVVQFGFGVSMLGKRRPKHELNFGIAGKYVRQLGGFKTYETSELIGADTDTAKNLINERRSTVGMDLGFQYVFHSSKISRIYASYVQNTIGFRTTSTGTSTEGGVGTFGLGYQLDLGLSQLTFAYDYRDIYTEQDWRKRLHLGVEFALPILSLRMGLNQAYLSGGVGVNLGIIKAHAVYYTEEQGISYGQDPEKRYLLRFEFLLPLL